MNFSMDKAALESESIIVNRTEDFTISGDGKSVLWSNTDWHEISERCELDQSLKTSFKTMYSESGIYFLFDCEDKEINATITEDYAHLWLEDVVEVFLWPNDSVKHYFEYELSPLNYELPLLLVNDNGTVNRWQPWYYEDDKRILHKTSIVREGKEEGGLVKGWIAEFFIPYSLLSSMGNVPPLPGTRWRSNMFRMDYSGDKVCSWSWIKMEGSFHNIDEFGVLVFE